jgi:long-chain-alcohol oxidase
MDLFFPALISTSCGRLTVRQEAALMAFAEALLPPIPAQEERHENAVSSKNDTTMNKSTVSTGDDPIRRYWEYRLSNDSSFIDTVTTTIQRKMSTFDRLSIKLLLSIMDTTIGTCILFNTYRHRRRFVDYTVSDRTHVLLPALQYSPYVLRRKIFHSFKRFLCGIAFTYHCDNMEYVNPFWNAMGYPGSPVRWQAPARDEELVQYAMERQSPIIKALELSKQALIQSIASSDNDAIQLDCDVVIVGSGSGGCVAASVLAKAGYDVIVLEKGSYQSPANISLHEIDAMEQQYEQSGLLQNSTGTIMILAGSALGGGTAINWSCCLPLPQYVRDEWINDHKLHASFGPDYDTALNHILGMISAPAKPSQPSENISDEKKTSTPHNTMNRKLQYGCNSLGFKWEETGQVCCTADSAEFHIFTFFHNCLYPCIPESTKPLRCYCWICWYGGSIW